MIADPTADDGGVGDAAARPGASAWRPTTCDTRCTSRGVAATANALAATALDEGYRYVVAVGDDATVQDVVNGLFRDGLADRRGAGARRGRRRTRATTCSGASGSPTTSTGACGTCSGENTYPFDVMRITTHRPRRRAGDRGTRTTSRRSASVPTSSSRRARLPRVARRPARGGSSGSGADTSARTRQVVRVGYDTKTWEGEGFHVVIGERTVRIGRAALASVLPGRRCARRPGVHGAESDAYTMLPRIMRHGGHVPDDAIKELRAKIRFSVEADRPLAVDGRRRAVRHRPRRPSRSCRSRSC